MSKERAGFPRLRAGLAGLLAALGLIAVGCGEETSGPAPDPGGNPSPMPDFARTDVNSTSPTFDTDVSPRDYLQTVSAWYFGHST